MVYGVTSMKNKKRQGFTLIELTVVTAIIGILASVLFVNYRAGGQNLRERRSIQEIAQAIRTAQNRALASDCPTPPCRFGVHFENPSSRLLIFIDKVVMNGRYDSGEEVETKEFEAGVQITNVAPDYACGGATCGDALFDPPDPSTLFFPAGADSLTVTITGGKKITVGKGGSVDVN